MIEGGVDFIIAETLPAIEEAIGIAQAAAEWQIPYFISFVIGRDGLILDGTKIIEAIQLIDQLTENPPLGYMVNCAYPTFLQAEKQPAALFNRLDGYLANASSLDHCDLDGAEGLFLDDINDWAKHMNALYYTYGVKVLGGCCGTNASHLKAILPPE